MASPLFRGHVLSRPLDGLDDVVVAGAATEVALQLVADQLFGRLGIALQHLLGGHDHPGGAEAALEAVLFPEALLDGMQLAVFGEPLDRGDRGAVGLDGEERAGLHRLPVHLDRAGATLAGVASHVRAGEPNHLADVVDQQQSRLDLVAHALPIDGHFDWQFHGSSSKDPARLLSPGLRGVREGKPQLRACQRPRAAASSGPRPSTRVRSWKAATRSAISARSRRVRRFSEKSSTAKEAITDPMTMARRMLARSLLSSKARCPMKPPAKVSPAPVGSKTLSSG